MIETQSIDDLEEQLADYFGFIPAVYITADEGAPFKIPNPALLDDDQQERWDELRFELEKCDRDDDGSPAHPYCMNGQPLKPSYHVRLGQALLGDRYAEYRAAGGSGNQIGLIWSRMSDAAGREPAAAAEDDE